MTLNEYIAALEELRAQEGGELEVWSNVDEFGDYEDSLPEVHTSNKAYSTRALFLERCALSSTNERGPKVVLV